MGIMEKDFIFQVMLFLVMWFFYLEYLYSKIIDFGLVCVSEVVGQMDIVKLVLFVFIVVGINGKGIICCMLEIILMVVGYKVGVYSFLYLVCYIECVCIQGVELLEVVYIVLFVEIEVVWGDILLIYFEYGMFLVLWLFKQVQLDVVIFEVGFGGCFDVINIVDVDVVVVISIVFDYIDWLGLDCESIGWEKVGIFCVGKLVVVGELDMLFIIVEVVSEKGVLFQCCGVDWCYEVEGEMWFFCDMVGVLSYLFLFQVLLLNVVMVVVVLCVSGFVVDDVILCVGICDVMFLGCFQIISDVL